jgi:hypothetical protein
VLRRTLGPKREKILGIWEKVSKEEGHILYSSQNQTINKTRSDKMGDACSVNSRGEKYIQTFSQKT